MLQPCWSEHERPAHPRTCQVDCHIIASAGEPAGEEHALADFQAVRGQGGAGVVAQLRQLSGIHASCFHEVLDNVRTADLSTPSLPPSRPEPGVDERGQPGHVFVPDRVALGLELTDRGVQVDGRPQYHAVQDQAERAELVLQAALVPVVQLALLAVADLAGQGVTTFLQVADPLDVAAVGLVDVDVVEDVQRLEDPAVGGARGSPAGRASSAHHCGSPPTPRPPGAGPAGCATWWRRRRRYRGASDAARTAPARRRCRRAGSPHRPRAQERL